MKLEKLHIKNYKSLVDLEINKPNPFTVFAGPNGAGKSNIFEALEFGGLLFEWKVESVVRLFGGNEVFNYRGKQHQTGEFTISYDFPELNFMLNAINDYKITPKTFSLSEFTNDEYRVSDSIDDVEVEESKYRMFDYRNQFFKSFSRIFIRNTELVRIKEISNQKLGIDCANLEKVLKRLLEDKNKREDITEYLEMMIPGFEKIEVYTDGIGGKDTLLVYEVGTEKPFTKDLISDGTYNIICLLTALFQSDEPQFLCIEEPENGLNPYVVQEFVELCRLMCEDYGHYIWLNTHSQTLVRALKEQELILVDKENGATKIKQFEKGSFHGLLADDAWLMNALGAGIPW